jgi:nickel and cobalt resistance protein CnrR
MSMPHRLRPLFWTAIAVALSAATAWVVARSAMPDHHHSHAPASSPDAGETFHDWLHARLEITPEQEARLAAIEVAYADQRKELLQRIQQAGQDLSAALARTPVGGEALNEALATIHDAQGELQRVTIEHFLKMREHLSPEQSQRLLQWTRESITLHDGH